MRYTQPYLIICLLFIFFLPSLAFSQTLCGFDAFHRKLQETSPVYEQQIRKQDQQIRSWLQQKEQAAKISLNGRVVNGAETIYEIPVVIHVVHTGDVVGTDYNPSDAQLLGMLDYLNQSFQATYPGYPAPGAGGTRVPFRFILAQRAPDCTPTTGIIRVDGSGVPNYTANGVNAQTAIGATDAQVKSTSVWPANQYYNIWIVNKIDGKDGYPGTVGSFVAGYAYFPGAPISVDGTVMLASQALAGRKTLPHELGHAFNLYHTFQDAAGATCSSNADCNVDGDQVCDTEPTNESAFFTCPAVGATNPCTSTSWGAGQQNNFMHYTNCGAWRFTPGQRNRMLASINTIRVGLLTSAGLQPPPAQLAVSAGCAPSSIINTGNQNQMGPVRVQFNSLDDSTGSYSQDGKFYVDHTCNMGTSVVEGQTYTLNLSTRLNPQVAKAWIDYNNNGSFEADELLLNSIAPTPEYTHTVQVTIPTGATLNSPLRMRVLADFYPYSGITACGNQAYGQTEDYSVTILSASTLPVKISHERIALKNGSVVFSFNASEEAQVIRYELQRAGKEGDAFSTIKSLTPSNSRIATNEYSVTDDEPVGETGWYRILAIEQDGRKFFSRIMGTPIRNTIESGNIRIYPNPTKGAINVNLPLLPGATVQLLLRDAQGRIVWSGNRHVQKTIVIPGGFPAGMYCLTAIAGSQQWNAKVIVTGK